MDAKEYVKYAIRTESTDKNKWAVNLTNKILSVLDTLKFPYKNSISARLIKPRNIRLLHFSMGLMTEVVEIVEFLEKKELDFVNLGEELADCLWYIAILIDELKLNPYILDSKFQGVITTESREELTKATFEIIKESGNILDIMKKGLYYGKEMNAEKIQERIIKMIIEMDKMCLIGKIDFKQSRTINIEKLAKRYGDKFSELKAIDRNLTAEREILNKLK